MAGYWIDQRSLMLSFDIAIWHREFSLVTFLLSVAERSYVTLNLH